MFQRESVCSQLEQRRQAEQGRGLGALPTAGVAA